METIQKEYGSWMMEGVSLDPSIQVQYGSHNPEYSAAMNTCAKTDPSTVVTEEQGTSEAPGTLLEELLTVSGHCCSN